MDRCLAGFLAVSENLDRLAKATHRFAALIFAQLYKLHLSLRDD